MKIEIEITPVPLARPRVNTTNRGRYLPPRSRKFQEELKTLLKASYKGEPLKKSLDVTIEFYKPFKVTAQKYGDIDNLAKAVLDACNGILWVDDRQICRMVLRKRKGEGKVIIWFHEKPDWALDFF